MIYSSLSTCDPGDIHETIAKLKTHKVRASVVGIGAEMVRKEACRRGRVPSCPYVDDTGWHPFCLCSV